MQKFREWHDHAEHKLVYIIAAAFLAEITAEKMNDVAYEVARAILFAVHILAVLVLISAPISYLCRRRLERNQGTF